jgi:hypothetical protein
MICVNSDWTSKRVSLTARTLAFVLFAHVLSTTTVVAQTCVVGDCSKNGCSFDKGIIKFGRTDGTLVSERNFRTRIPHERINCHSQGNWQRPGNSSRGVPYRSPCTVMSDRRRVFPDVWLSDFAVTNGNRISYRWKVNDEWKLNYYLKPKKVFVNEYLKCHQDDPSMIIVEDDKENPVMEIGIPLEFIRGGGDSSPTEAFIGAVIFLGLLFTILMACCVVPSDDYNDFGRSSGFADGVLVGCFASSFGSDWGSSSGGFGGWGDD